MLWSLGKNSLTKAVVRIHHCFFIIIFNIFICNNRDKFHVTVINQNNRSMVYFTVWRSISLDVLNADPCNILDVKLGLRSAFSLRGLNTSYETYNETANIVFKYS